jgi:hypothetical protein
MFTYVARLHELRMTLLINLIFSDGAETCIHCILDSCENIVRNCSNSNAREHKCLFFTSVMLSHRKTNT